MLKSRIFLANIGANSSHPFSSPIFDNGTFELIPIPEKESLRGPGLVYFKDLRSFYDSKVSLLQYIPSRYWDIPCHYDPEFLTFTYGDNCGTAPRASGLKKMQRGDLLFFLARLVNFTKSRFTDEAGFYLIGFLEVDDILATDFTAPPPVALRFFGENAHIRRALVEPALFNGFWMFKGSPRSVRFSRAVPLTRGLAQALFTSADGSPWRWDGRSDLQVIGSYTRSCRCVIDPSCPGGDERAWLLWSRLREHNPELDRKLSF